MKVRYGFIVILCIFWAAASTSGFARPDQDALRLYEEADALWEKAGSKDDLKKVESKFQQVLKMAERLGNANLAGHTCMNLGLIYWGWGEYEKAVQHQEKALSFLRRIKDLDGQGRAWTNIGLAYHYWNKYDMAVQAYEKALALSKQVKSAQGEAAVLSNLGMVYMALHQYQKAAERYEQALVIARKIGDKAKEAAILTNLGGVYTNWSQYQKAVEYLEKALEIKTGLKDMKESAYTLGGLGRVYEDWGQYQKAVEFYEKALEIRSKLGDAEGESSLLLQLANVYQHWGQDRKAVEYYEKSIDICKRIGNPSGEAKAVHNLGRVYQDRGQYDKALELYEKSLAINRKLGLTAGEGSTLHSIGRVAELRGQYERALELYEKDLAIDRKIGDVSGEAACLSSVGGVYANWGQYEKALEFYGKSLDIYTRIGAPSGEAAVLQELGRVYHEQGLHQKALEFSGKALEIARNLGAVKDQAGYHIGVGNVYLQWGQYQKAMESYQKSLELAKKLGYVQAEAAALGNLGCVNDGWGQHERATEFYEKAIALFKRLGQVRDEAEGFLAMGGIYQNRGEYAPALKSYEQALKLYEKIRAPTRKTKQSIADVYLDMSDVAKAESVLEGLDADAVRGRLNLMKSQYQQAGESYGKLLKEAEISRSIVDLFTAYTGMGLAYEGMKDDKSAADHFSKAVKLVEDQRTGLTPEQREKFFDVTVNGFYRTAPYEGLARVLIRLNRPSEAWKTSEYTKARLFAEAISRRSEGTRLDVPADVAAADRGLNDQLAAFKKRLQTAYEKADKSAVQTLVPQVAQWEEKLTAHRTMLREKYPLFAAAKYPEPMDVSQAALNPDEWAVAYDLTDSGVIIYVNKGKILKKALFKPIPRKDVDDLVRKFRKPMEIGPDDSVAKKLAAFDFASGKKLSDLLLADILPDLPKGAPVMIVPDGSLGVVPFEMLVLNEGGKVMTDKKVPYTAGAEFFGDRNPISCYQSITALTLARTLGKRQKAGDQLLAMVDPVFSSDDPRLMKLAKNEKDSLLGALPKDLLMSIRTESGMTFPRLPLTGQLGESLKKGDTSKTDLYEGIAAKKSVLLGKDLTQYRSVVFGTHGYFGKDLPGIQEPVLVLSLVGEPKGQDGFLRLSDVMGLKINCDIAALTACQTGLGRHVSGEGTMGMGRAFQYAGAKSVLMSLWSVAEKSSVTMVEAFFRHIKEGRNKLEALRLSREEIRKDGYDHPFFWAPFILVGEVQ